MPGTVDGDAVASEIMRPTTATLRTAAYSAAEGLGITHVEDWVGISYANRGCWVCYYMIAGIIATLLYGVCVLVFRKVASGRKPDGATSSKSSDA